MDRLKSDPAAGIQKLPFCSCKAFTGKVKKTQLIRMAWARWICPNIFHIKGGSRGLKMICFSSRVIDRYPLLRVCGLRIDENRDHGSSPGFS